MLREATVKDLVREYQHLTRQLDATKRSMQGIWDLLNLEGEADRLGGAPDKVEPVPEVSGYTVRNMDPAWDTHGATILSLFDQADEEVLSRKDIATLLGISNGYLTPALKKGVELGLLEEFRIQGVRGLNYRDLRKRPQEQSNGKRAAT